MLSLDNASIRGDAGMGRRCWPYGQWLLAGFCCLSGTFGPSPGLAAEARQQLGPGAFDLTDGARSAAAFAEYRPGPERFGIGPMAGILANREGGVFGYGGVYWDLAAGPWHLVPALAVGGYRQGDSKDLGGVFQFREAVEIAYQLENGMRLGLQIAHISNAGIYASNPGQEDLMVTVSLPLGYRF
jgi:hypothetical protein